MKDAENKKQSANGSYLFTMEDIFDTPPRGYGVTNRITYIARSAVCGFELLHYNDMSKEQREATRELARRIFDIYKEVYNKKIWENHDDK